MDLRIIHVRNHGDLANEHIAFAADDYLRLWHYIIMDSTYKDNGAVSNKHRHVFDFDECKAITLEDGDIVLLYTKKGSYSEGTSKDGSKVHYLYWGLEDTIWNKDGDEAILIKVEERNKKSV